MAEDKINNKPNGKLVREVKIPEGIDANIEGKTVILKKDASEISRKINDLVNVSKEDDWIRLSIKTGRKNEKKNLGTAEGHIKNMIDGLNKKFEYELEICNVHFPMNVSFDQTSHSIIIKNLLGEKSPRLLKIPQKVEVEIKAPKIKLKSYDIEAAGQVAANLEKVTQIKYRDRNKFQDGIFITKKPGVEYL